MAKIKAARAHLVEALQKATFSTAMFNDDMDLAIKKETMLYRTTWVIPPIMNALRDIDPCGCKSWDQRFCTACGGTGIKDGLPFDPWELSREAAEKDGR